MIYLIGGPPRCGKTTLAKEMSKKLKIPWISSDALEVVSREYVSKDRWRKLYPYSFLRKERGNRNNDKFYNKYSAREIINVLKKQAKASFRLLKIVEYKNLRDIAFCGIIFIYE